MSKLLKGKPVSDSIVELCAEKVSEIITKTGCSPKLAVVSIGNDASNDSYLKGISKKCGEAGIEFSINQLEENSSYLDVKKLIEGLNEDEKVSGILLMRPLPDTLASQEREICNFIDINKDIDAASDLSVAGPFLGSNAYPPCTAEACIKILDFYNIDIASKHVVVVGRRGFGDLLQFKAI